jgi:hypothetical protein
MLQEGTGPSPRPATTCRELASTWLARFDGGRFIAAELMVVAAVIASFSKAQSDTYWHLAAGRTMWKTGTVMLTDVFSHTNYGAPWMNYEWLSEVALYGAYIAGGMPLVTAMCGALALGACVLTWQLIRGPLGDRVLLMALALTLMTPGWSLRPQVFTLFLLGAMLHLVPRERFLFLPPLFALWANLHGAVALGLVVLAGDFLAALFSRRGWQRRAAFGVLCFAATLLTPLGLSYWPAIWHSLHRSSANAVSEWMPPGLSPRYMIFWLMASALVWLVITRWRHLDRHGQRSIVVIALLLLPLAVRSSRNIIPFAMAAAPALSYLVWRPGAEQDAPRRPTLGAGTAVRAAVFTLSVVAAILVVHHRWTSEPPPADWTPMSSAAAGAIRDCAGPIYNHYNAGGFIIWFVPEQRVFLDSRQDPYPTSLVQAQTEARTPAALSALLERHGTRCAAVTPGTHESPMLRELGWTETYRDAQWVVMVRGLREFRE